jgi:5-methylcytosine-specific restriction endonuclease McrA
MECGWDKINPITNNVPIELEHIDGDSTNNSLENLKLLCPNCHSLTPTFGALNKGNGRWSKRKLNRRKRYNDGKSS